jgi:two-component system chemotaxis sensor kinase CheA
MDMSKYREMFFPEAKEHLKNMSRQLIALEKNPSDRERIDFLFRDAHSIKGMAASMGYDQTAQLAHYLENFLDGFRRSGTVFPEAVDRLLDGVDLLEGLIGNLEEGRPERKVATFISSTFMPDPTENRTVTLPTVTTGKTIDEGMLIMVELAADAASSAGALLVLKKLEERGKLLSCMPTLEQLNKGEPVLCLEARLQTDQTPAQLEKILTSMTYVERVTFRSVQPKKTPPPPRREDGSQTVRVRTDLLDRFINLTGELITNRYALQDASKKENWQEVREGLDRLSQLIGDLHHHVLQVRMMPLESITGRLPRLVRDLCRKTGKEISLRVEGEGVELDRVILEEMADPLVHMVRNAIDHGIEKTGELTVKAWREKDLVLLEVADNGQGMDPGAIRKKAVGKGLLSFAQAQALADRDVLQLICHPGFSTAAEVTGTSGRGVGMDVVKSAVENVGGTLEIVSQRGRGTRFLLKLPLSVAIVYLLLVECDGHMFGIPITRVLRILEISQEEVRFRRRQMVIRLEDLGQKEEEDQEKETVPLLSLRKILGLPSSPYKGSIPVVITEARGRRVGLVVDRLAGQREAFVKALAFPLDRLAGVSGATVMGDGSVVFIIDPQFMLEKQPSPFVTRLAGEQQRISLG